jgi:hypothetical protein
VFIAILLMVVFLAISAGGMFVSPYLARKLEVAEPGRLVSPLPSGRTLARTLFREAELLAGYGEKDIKIIVVSGLVENLGFVQGLAEGAAEFPVILVVPNQANASKLSSWAATNAPGLRVVTRSGRFSGTVCLVAGNQQAVVWSMGAGLAADEVLATDMSFAFRSAGPDAKSLAESWIRSLR